MAAPNQTVGRRDERRDVTEIGISGNHDPRDRPTVTLSQAPLSSTRQPCGSCRIVSGAPHLKPRSRWGITRSGSTR